MRAIDRAAWGIVLFALLLFVLGHVLPGGWESDFFSRLAAKRRTRSEPQWLSAVRLPVRLPVPERYIKATRAAVARRMAEPDWAHLSRDRRREILLEIFVLSAVDTEYWAMPETRQRQVAEAYVQAFLDFPAGDQRALPLGTP